MNGLPAAELALLFQYAYTTVQQLESPACKTLPAEDILDSSLFILCVCVSPMEKLHKLLFWQSFGNNKP